ncbi:hypothetical protein [Adlercreutzia sp. ZJ473]|uniref:hypothetical protein n=1 Tax=Adlercreutzia sp. ZJ473 TaxID=2722822 RepID=UPI001557D076|nr:hypothetical protein [Adlercreutzia sp. ZJ473]
MTSSHSLNASWSDENGSKSRVITKLVSVVLCVVLASALPVGSAFAYNFIQHSPSKYWYVSPTYTSYNTGAYNQMGYYSADCYSFMNIACTSQAASSGSITSQAGITVGNALGTETMHWGTAVTNWGGSSKGSYVQGSLSHTINYSEGAAAWGYGTVKSNSSASYEVTSSNIFLLTLTDPGIMSAGEDTGTNAAEWTPGMHNFVGEDGLVYGVPYTNENGETVMPDMGRVEASNSEIGYIVIADMDDVIYNGAVTDEDRLQAIEENAKMEAAALKEAFEEYYGIDALDYESALECVMSIRYKDGKAAAVDAMSEGAKASSLGQADGINVLEDDFDAIFELARPSMMVSMPVYSEDGSVVGEFSFERL